MAASQEEQLNAKQEHLKDHEDLNVTHHDDHSHDAEDGKRKGHNPFLFYFIHKHDKHKNGEHKNCENKTVKEKGDQPKTGQTSQEQHEASQNDPHSQEETLGTKEETQETKEETPETKEETPNEGKKPEEHKDHEKEKSRHLHFHGLGFRPMAHCLDFRSRTVSFDLHNIGDNHKMSLLSKLLHRSKSESSMKVPALKKEKEGRSSPANNSPKQSPGAAPRRRFSRVVRDDQCIGEEYVNPHVTRRFSKNHWEKHFLTKSASLDEGGDESRPLPYTVTGHTILKKHHSVDCDTLCSDANKHAKFNEEVEVLEYDIKGKILAIHSDASILHAKLHDGELVHEEVVLSREVCDAISVGGVEVELPIPACVTLEVITEATTPTDLSPDDVDDSDVTDTTVLTENQMTADPLTDSDAEDLVSDSVFDDHTDSAEHTPKASRQISSEEEGSVKKTKLEDVTAESIEIVCEKLKEVES